MDNRRLLIRLARGEVRNVRFADVCRLAEALGFELRRVTGSHQAKPYQIRQLMRLVELYDLELEAE